ncbi:ASP-1 protein [Aphelenchoides avenae]|nr:ASP-1 protein [Aphelenchus avenae]
MDGIIGLTLPYLDRLGVLSPVENILPLLDKPLFSVWLDRRVHLSRGGNGGLITWGAIDMKNCDSAWDYIPLTSNSAWQFRVNR